MFTLYIGGILLGVGSLICYGSYKLGGRQYRELNERYKTSLVYQQQEITKLKRRLSKYEEP